MAVARKRPQIERPLRVAHAGPVAGRAMAREQGRASAELLWSKLHAPILRRGARAEQREAKACGCDRFHVVANHLPFIRASARTSTLSRRSGSGPPLS